MDESSDIKINLHSQDYSLSYLSHLSLRETKSTSNSSDMVNSILLEKMNSLSID